MSWTLHPATGGGWRPEGVRPGLCHLFSLHPAPPGGPRALVGTEGGLGGISPTAETSVAPLQRICGWGLCASRWRHPPHTLTHMHSRGRLLCKRVGGGVLWVLSALKHWFHQSRNPGDGPLPLQVPTFPRKEESLLIHPNQEVLPRESLPLIFPGSPSWFLCLNSFPTCIAHNQHSHMHLPCIFLMSGPRDPLKTSFTL